MVKKPLKLFLILLFSFLLISISLFTSEVSSQERTTKDQGQASISITDKMGDAMIKEAAKVREEITEQVRSLFDRTSLGWDLETLEFLYKWILTLPLKVPVFMKYVLEQSRVLGVLGSLIVLVFILATLYSLTGRKKVLIRVEKRVQPLRNRIPETIYPYFLSLLRVVVASLIPIVLLSALSLIDAFVAYAAPWFLLTKRLLGLWAVGALLINLLRESLIRDLLPVNARYGKTLFQVSRLVLLYALGGIGVLWGAEAFQLAVKMVAKEGYRG